MKARVLVTHPLISGGLKLIEEHYQVDVAPGLEDPRELRRAIRDVDALIPLLTVRVDDALLEQAQRLKIVANYAVGYDNVDLKAATDRGIWVTNTPGVLTEATAELTWAALLAVTRRVVEGDALMRAGRYAGWGPTMLLGTQLAGKILGIVGFGQIGRAVALRAAGFSMQVLYSDTDEAPRQVDLARGLVNARRASLEELLGQADFVTLHTPLTSQTRHLIDDQRLRRMKSTAYLINTSRGPVVDERALVEHLRAGTIAGAALDVYEEEPRMAPGLAALDNVVLLPHLGSATVEARTGMANRAAQNVHAVLQGRTPPDAVNRPSRPRAEP